MLVSEAITKIRTGTLHDVDDQVSAAQYLAIVSDDYRRVRRWLCVHAPDLCTQKVSAIAVAATSITKATSLPDFERVVCVRKLDGSAYYPLNHENRLNAVVGGSEPGTYEVEYLSVPSGIQLTDTIALPLGLEDVVVERGCAAVRQRHNEDIGRIKYHHDLANEMLREAAGLLAQRGGLAGDGLIRHTASQLVWFESPTTIEIRSSYL